jgi:phenylacetate-coenzyme A ligase PaaK-like adenylate-forming protein
MAWRSGGGTGGGATTVVYDERDANNMEKLPLRIFRSTFVFHGVVTTGNSIFTGYQKYPAKG